jgi:anti-sigma factor RsiW
MTPHTHLADDQLLDRYLADGAMGADVEACPACRARHQQLTTTLEEITVTATALADAAFPAERLARQRVRILQRLQHMSQQGRVIAFPVRSGRRPLMQPRPLRRWVAGAAAAGLVVGMVAGHMVHELPLERRPTPAMSASVGATVADDDLLREIEAAVGTPLPAGLRRIGDVTPIAWDVQ